MIFGEKIKLKGYGNELEPVYHIPRILHACDLFCVCFFMNYKMSFTKLFTVVLDLVNWVTTYLHRAVLIRRGDSNNKEF